MCPSDTVDNSSSSSSSSFLNTQGPQGPTPSGMDSAMVDQVNTPQLALLSKEVEQIKSTLESLCLSLSQLVSSSGSAPVDPAPAVGPVEPPTQTVPRPHVAKLKMAIPDFFDGNLAKSEAFINSCELYFYGKVDICDSDKVCFALSYMKGGTAGQWSKRKIKEYSKIRGGAGPTWKEFFKDFCDSFYDPDQEGTAVHKLKELKQGNSTCDEYVSNFKELMDFTGFNDAALKSEFEHGLSSTLVDKIYTLQHHPKNLKEWMEAALKMDRLARKKEQRHKHSTQKYSTQPRLPSHTSTPANATIPKPPPPQTRPPPPQYKPPTSEVVPMEIDNNRRSAGPKVCYRCRQPGHFARDCKFKVDINAMDFDSLRVYFNNLKDEEEPKAKDTPGKDFQ